MPSGANILDVDALIQQWWSDLQPGPNWPSKDQFVIDTTGVRYDLVDFAYETPNPVQTPHALASSTYVNDSDVQDSQLFSDTKTTTATFQWTVTAGIKFGAKESVKVSLPEVADVSAEVSWEISLGLSVAQVLTSTETWQWSTTINVPAKSRLTASVVLNEARYEPHFSARVVLAGSVGYHTADRSVAGAQSIAGILAGRPGVEVDGDLAVYTVQGIFQGVQGMGYVIETQQEPLTAVVLP